MNAEYVAAGHAEPLLGQARPGGGLGARGNGMKGRTAAIGLGAALALSILAQPLAAEPTKPVGTGPKLPADAVAYVTRRKGCNHWGSEVAYDAARGRDIAAAVTSLRCDAIDADEARLRRRYGKDPTVLKALDKSDGPSG